MVTTIIIIVSFISLIIIGFIHQLMYLKEIEKKYEFTVDYNNAFVAYLDSHGNDINKYQYLIKNSSRMQNLLGSQGFMSLKPPFANYIIHDYAIVINGIPDLKKLIDAEMSGLSINGYIQFIIDSLTRYIGDIENEENDSRKYLYNPIKWFLSGFRLVFNIPIYILSSLEIFSINTKNRIVNSIIYKIVTGIFALVGFGSSLLTVIIGWDQFYKIVLTIIIKK